MITTRSLANQTWIDLSSPTKEEVDSLILTQDISPFLAKDLLSPTPIQYAESDGKNIYTVFHIPILNNNQKGQEHQEVDFIIQEQGVITGRYDSIDAIHYFAKLAEVGEILNKSNGSHLFFGIMQEIYKTMSNELSFMEDWMKDIEKNIFEGQEKKMVFAISSASRNLLNFKRMVEPQGNIFEYLKTTGKEKFGEKFEKEVKTLIKDWHQIIKRVNNQMDLMTELRETNNSLLSTKQNEITKKLAVIGFIFLPITIVIQLFSTSFKYFPLLDHPKGFWIVLGITVIVMLIMLTYAKIKKWM